MIGFARGYLAAQPYGASSSLLFVSIPGAGAAFNHPEIVGRRVRSDAGETSVDERSEAQLAGWAARAPARLHGSRGCPTSGRPGSSSAWSRSAAPRVLVGAGEPLAIVERAQNGVARTFVLAGAITLALALLVSYLAGARVSAPLRRMASVATRVDAGELEPRMDDDARAGER